MSSVGKPLVVALDGTSIAPADLGVAHLAPGTDGQALLTSGGVTGWGSVPEPKLSWSFQSISITSNQDVSALGFNVLTGVNMVTPLGTPYGSTGTGGITSPPFINNDATTVMCTYGTADSIYRVTFHGQVRNTNATAGGSLQLVSATVNGVDKAFPSSVTAPITSNGTITLHLENYIAIQAGQTLGFKAFGNGGAGDLRMSGQFFIEYVSSTV